DSRNASLGRMSKNKSNTKINTSHEGKSKPKNPSPEHVSLDNAGTVIEGGPAFLNCFSFPVSKNCGCP
ncbi:MAG TPA: hypothetical protein VEH47_00110, partial [Candidatus Acidoferrales bacterium]|nr:hypothetical protein [Candidatus Acidoferrales bacterium]